MVDIATLGIAVDSRQVDQASDKLDDLAKSGQKAQGATEGFEGAAKRTNTTTNKLRGTVGQLGFQVQDIAVQLQSGQNALLVFGQQGSQIASIFGPAGAIAGAVIAIGAAVGTALVPQLFNTKSAADRLEASMDQLSDTIQITKFGTIELTDEFRRLAETSEQIAQVQIQARLLTAMTAAEAAFDGVKESVQGLNGSIEDSSSFLPGAYNGLTSKQVEELRGLIATAISTKSTEDIERLRSRISELSLSGGEVNERFKRLADTLNQSTIEYAKQQGIITKLKQLHSDLDGTLQQEDQILSGLRSEWELLNEQEREAARLIRQGGRQERLDALQAERELLRQLREEQQALNRVESDFSSAQTTLLTDQERIRDAFYDRKEAIEAAMAAGVQSEIDYGVLLERNRELMEEQIAALEDRANSGKKDKTKEGDADELSDITKNMVEGIQSGLSGIVYDAITSDFDDIGDAFGQLFTRIAAEATAAHLTQALFGDISSGGSNSGWLAQAGGFLSGVLSADGGGYLGDGPRVGGVDGKGGFLMIGHPQETVVDHTRGQGMGLTIGSINLPGVTDERTARRATGIVKRELSRSMSAAGRYA